MADRLTTEKRDATDFLLEQVMKLDREQKEKLSYVLLGATMSQELIGKPEAHERRCLT